MNPLLVAAIIDLGTTIEPALAKLLAAGIEALVKALVPAPATTAGVMAEIIRGIDVTHPDWSGVMKHAYALGAVAQYMSNHRADPSDTKALNALLELGVQALADGTVDPEVFKQQHAA